MTILGAGLIAAGLLGMLVPGDLAPMSGAPAYNVFHLTAGACALALLQSDRPGLMAGFNLTFGLIDVWQLVAGLTGLFPDQLFALKTADHVVHGAVGIALTFVGALGLAAFAGQPRPLPPTGENGRW